MTPDQVLSLDDPFIFIGACNLPAYENFEKLYESLYKNYKNKVGKKFY